MHTLFWTGMRPSEVAGLRWSNVDLDRARLTIVRSRHLYEDSAPRPGGPNAPWTCSLKPCTSCAPSSRSA
ncbi:MAG: hypothetical protein E6J60_09930 [Deltaproteobacteria bacterium]|nr:MAG: hypothetical protein E6J60_09930 [Deltaproteobacteria bacterium]